MPRRRVAPSARLLDGELGLSADEAEITRIRRFDSGTMLVVNDNAPLALRDYFSPGGAGADLTLYISRPARAWRRSPWPRTGATGRMASNSI